VLVGHGVSAYRRRRQPGQPTEAGNAALELLILAPVLILLICMVIAAGRIAVARGAIDAAARDAARQASIARSPQDALSTARATAGAELGGEHLNCSVLTVGLPGVYRAFATPLGQPASVTATVRCTVSLSDLILPGLPGSVPLTFSFSSPLDPFRGRA
jgi:Flp pilus assembly protein TadG